MRQRRRTAPEASAPRATHIHIHIHTHIHIRGSAGVASVLPVRTELNMMHHNMIARNLIERNLIELNLIRKRFLLLFSPGLKKLWRVREEWKEVGVRGGGEGG